MEVKKYGRALLVIRSFVFLDAVRNMAVLLFRGLLVAHLAESGWNATAQLPEYQAGVSGMELSKRLGG
jgi:hypothetical protein